MESSPLRAYSTSGASTRNSLADASLAIQPERTDELRDRRRDELCDRLAGGNAPAHLARRDVRRVELELEHAVAVAAEIGFRIPGASPHAERHVLQHLVGVLPGVESPGLVGAEDEDGVVEPASTHGVHGVWMGLELDMRVRKSGSRELQARLGVDD